MSECNHEWSDGVPYCELMRELAEARTQVKTSADVILHERDNVVKLKEELAEARREIVRLRKIVKCEHTTPPDDVADDNSTELAVMLAEARMQVGAAADVILYEHGEVERLRKALVMIRDMPEIDQDDAYRLRACASDALKGVASERLDSLKRARRALELISEEPENDVE